MNLIQVQAFLAAARSLSFTQAAEELFLSQQAVSKHIHNLELELGYTLFDRSRGGVALTDEGGFYNNLFSNEISLGRRLLEEVRLERLEIEGRFRFGYSAWLDPFGELDKGLTAFRRANPDVTFSGCQYHNERLMKMLAEGELDMAVISGGQLVEEVDFEFVGFAEERIALCVPDDIEAEEVDRECWGLPMLKAASWNWGPFEWKRISSEESTSLDLAPREIFLLPNVQSILSELATSRCCAVLDERFGIRPAGTKVSITR